MNTPDPDHVAVMVSEVLDCGAPTFEVHDGRGWRYWWRPNGITVKVGDVVRFTGLLCFDETVEILTGKPAADVRATYFGWVQI